MLLVPPWHQPRSAVDPRFMIDGLPWPAWLVMDDLDKLSELIIQKANNFSSYYGGRS